MSRTLTFTKMHGAGNDFVVLDGAARRRCHRSSRWQPLPLRPPLRDRRRSGPGGAPVPAGGLPHGDLQRRRLPGGDVRQRDPLPSTSTCATGITRIGTRSAWRHSRAWCARAGPGEDRVTVDMGLPVLEPAKIPTTLAAGDGPVLDVPSRSGARACGSRRSPWATPTRWSFVDDPDTAPVERLGPAIEQHPAFPNRVNVEFACAFGRQPHPPADLGARHRRDAGLRERCLRRGRGIHAVREAVEREVTVELRGGELEISWPARRGPRHDDRPRGRGLPRRGGELPPDALTRPRRQGGRARVRRRGHGAGHAVSRRRRRRGRAARRWSSARSTAGVDGLVPCGSTGESATLSTPSTGGSSRWWWRHPGAGSGPRRHRLEQHPGGHRADPPREARRAPTGRC